MKVAIIDSLGAHGGFHYYVDGVASGLGNAGVDTVVFTTEETVVTGQENYRIIRAFCGLYGSDSIAIRMLRFFRSMTGAVFAARRSGCEIAHFQSIQRVRSQTITEPFGLLLARLVGMKVVLTLHDIETEWRFSRAVARYLMFSLASALIVHNKFSLEQLALVAPDSVVRERTSVVPSGHYIAQFPYVPDRAEARAKLGLPQDKTIFLFFGNPRLDKGLDLLLKAMPAMRDQSQFLLLVGGKMKADMLELYRAIIDEHGIEAQVRMDVGHIADEDVCFYYRAADLVVLPYRRIFDSAVTTMAMSFGRAVLASDLPPLVEATENGQYGFLFASEDVDDLARALKRAFAERETLDGMGERARQHVLKERNWDLIGTKTAAVYARVSAGITRGATP